MAEFEGELVQLVLPFWDIFFFAKSSGKECRGQVDDDVGVSSPPSRNPSILSTPTPQQPHKLTKRGIALYIYKMAEPEETWEGSFDPLADPEERRVLFATLDSFRCV